MNVEQEITWLKGQLITQGEVLFALIGGVVDVDEYKAALRQRTERGVAQLLGSAVGDDVRDVYEKSLAEIINGMTPTSNALQARVTALGRGSSSRLAL